MTSSLPDEYKRLVLRVTSGDFEVTSIPMQIDCPSSFRTRKKAEDWLAANLTALNDAGVKVRRCLCCQGQFLSLGAHNRMCQPCRRAVSAEGIPASFSHRKLGAAHV